jgi:nucleotide-binding universal stress UspA family protein
LSILTVFIPPLVAGITEGTACSALVFESVMAQSKAILAGAAAAAEQADVSYTTQIRWGDMAELIRRSAEAEDCDLIIVGSRACTWRRRRLLHYAIKRLMACARQPLLVVTEPPQEAYGGVNWSRLLVVHDGSPSGEVAVHHTLSLARVAGADVCLLPVDTLWQSSAGDPLSVRPHVQDVLTLTAARTAIAGVDHDIVLTSVAHPRGWKRLVHGHPVRAVITHTTLPVLLVNPLVTSWS